MRMLKLRRDINRVVMLLDMVKRREKLKKENLNLTSDVYHKRYQCEDWDGSMLQAAQVQVQKPAPAKVTMQPYPLSSWMNVGGGVGGGVSDQHVLPVKREKRIYRKRKHHRSGLIKNGIAGLLRGERTLLSLIPDTLSSDEGRASSIGARQVEVDPDEAEENEGPFAFRRKAGVEYQAPLEDMFVDSVDRFESLHDTYLPVVASLDLSRAPENLGFCRRRMGRGGRVVLDRIAGHRWDSAGAWAQSSSIFGDENRVLRPITPENLQVKEWDPYRTRDHQIFAN